MKFLSEKATLYWPKGVFFWRRKARYAEGYLVERIRHGRWVFWYRSGQRQLEGEYEMGRKTGTWVKWTENGAKITEGEFFSDKMHGRWTDWYENGQKAVESRWYMGKRDGKWTYWDTDGALKEVRTYDYRYEEDKGYSIHTDLEAKELVHQIQRENVDRTWESLTGRFVASLVKPWQVACWVLIFIPTFSLIKNTTPWRAATLAAILAFLLTSLLTWSLSRRG
jgi:hypothetical protein